MAGRKEGLGKGRGQRRRRQERAGAGAGQLDGCPRWRPTGPDVLLQPPPLGSAQAHQLVSCSDIEVPVLGDHEGRHLRGRKEGKGGRAVVSGTGYSQQAVSRVFLPFLPTPAMPPS